MTVYRPAPEVPRLPLPRRHVPWLAKAWTWGASAVALGPYLVTELHAPETSRHAPKTLDFLRLVSFLVACLCTRAAAGATGRQERRRALALAIVPALLASWVTSSLGVDEALRDLGQVPPRLARTAAEGTITVLDLVQANAYLVAAFAAAFGALVLLSAAASVDDRRDPAPPRSGAPALLALACGLLLSTAAVALHAPSAGSGAALVVSLLVVALGHRVSRLERFVARAGPEDEAGCWRDDVATAAVLAGASLALFLHAASLVAESHRLDNAMALARGGGAVITAQVRGQVDVIRLAGLVWGAILLGFGVFARGARHARTPGIAIVVVLLAAWTAAGDRARVGDFLERATAADGDLGGSRVGR